MSTAVPKYGSSSPRSATNPWSRPPPGTLLRIDHEEGGYLIVPEVIGQDPGSEAAD